MAKIKFSALVSEMRNKLNGSVLSKNRYGNYLRNKVSPVNPQSTHQQNARSILSANSSLYGTITQAQRNGWRALAEEMPFTDIFGDVKHLSAQAMFVKLNSNLNKIALPSISVAPARTAVPTVFFTAVTFTAGAGTAATAAVTISPATIPAGFELILFATPAVNPGVEFVKNKYRMLGKAGAPVSGVIDIASQWNDRFGTLEAGQKVFVRGAFISTTSGMQGIPAEIRAIAGS